MRKTPTAAPVQFISFAGFEQERITTLINAVLETEYFVGEGSLSEVVESQIS